MSTANLFLAFSMEGLHMVRSFHIRGSEIGRGGQLGEVTENTSEKPKNTLTYTPKNANSAGGKLAAREITLGRSEVTNGVRECNRAASQT